MVEGQAGGCCQFGFPEEEKVEVNVCASHKCCQENQDHWLFILIFFFFTSNIYTIYGRFPGNLSVLFAKFVHIRADDPEIKSAYIKLILEGYLNEPKLLFDARSLSSFKSNPKTFLFKSICTEDIHSQTHQGGGQY